MEGRRTITVIIDKSSAGADAVDADAVAADDEDPAGLAKRACP